MILNSRTLISPVFCPILGSGLIYFTCNLCRGGRIHFQTNGRFLPISPLLILQSNLSVTTISTTTEIFGQFYKIELRKDCQTRTSFVYSSVFLYSLNNSGYEVFLFLLLSRPHRFFWKVGNSRAVDTFFSPFLPPDQSFSETTSRGDSFRVHHTPSRSCF